MTDGVAELYDYDALRREGRASVFVVAPSRTTVVLGSRQALDVLNPRRTTDVTVRRRRGGGGAVLVQPGDLWIDWWIPADDPRWIGDVRVAAVQTGRWWRDALGPLVGDAPEVYDGPARADADHEVACFAGRGPGEVFVTGRKAVGLTQWRVREGAFLSSVLPAHPTRGLVDLLASPGANLAAALDHHTLGSLGLDDPRALEDTLVEATGPWTVRHLVLGD